IQVSGGPEFLAYAPVNGTDGWSIAVAAPKATYLADTYFGILIDVLVIAAAILASIVVAVKLSTNISAPMQACVKRMKLLVEGDLDSPIPQSTGNDETAELTQATADMVSGLKIIISDIGYLLNEMANANFDIQSPHRDAYVGGYQSILLSMRNLIIVLSNTMRSIDAASNQVASASEQVSVGSQRLSQGAIEQASAVEELAATIAEISESAKSTSEAAEEAGRFVEQAATQMNTSVEYVKELNEAMEKISASSMEISKIIAAIENIAFQTNILALNAAVEAARAGSAGKGFAVVADEVRNLASKSDEAAKATKDLIGGSIAAVGAGRQSMDLVTDSLEQTAAITGNVTTKMNIVVKAVDAQTHAIDQVTEGIDQISAVVQTNSATAQESAAASEEMSAEASSLKQLVDRFTLARDV
ncbi:MAG: methyl-accepting chemotaxis protein, partial [Oscillospiraceae bacterium]|nr:methyl-accepting chemotaxis protein [Oscillospiraceae bacterium]